MKIKLTEAIKLIESKTGKKVVLEGVDTFISKSSATLANKDRSFQQLLAQVVWIFGREYGEGKKFPDVLGGQLLDAIREKLGIAKGEIK